MPLRAHCSPSELTIHSKQSFRPAAAVVPVASHEQPGVSVDHFLEWNMCTWWYALPYSKTCGLSRIPPGPIGRCHAGGAGAAGGSRVNGPSGCGAEACPIPRGPPPSGSPSYAKYSRTLSLPPPPPARRTTTVGVASPPASAAEVLLCATIPWYCQPERPSVEEKAAISEPTQGSAGSEKFTRSGRPHQQVYRPHLIEGGGGGGGRGGLCVRGTSRDGHSA